MVFKEVVDDGAFYIYLIYSYVLNNIQFLKFYVILLYF